MDWIAAARRQADSFKRGPRDGVPHSSGSPSKKSQPLPSRILNGYEILNELHRGGQGVVYRAVQQSTGRTVAIKVMREGPFASEQDRHRFNREVGILAQLSHPAIVEVIDCGVASGSHYLVMPCIDGLPLDQYVKKTRLDLKSLLTLFAEICETVNVAHLRGIIHRDLKPGNVLVDDAGRPHVLDFGLAKLTASATEDPSIANTLVGQFIGSLPWASPEQLQGTPEQIDTRTDVYSLGVNLYRLLTGEFPYHVDGHIRSVLEQIATADPEPPSKMAARFAQFQTEDKIDRDLDALVLKCLAKSPDERYQTAGELARDLRRYLKGEAIEARKLTTVYVLGKSLKRHRIAVAFAASLAVVVAAGTITSIVLWRQAVTQRDRAMAAELAERRQAARAVAETRNAQATTNFLQSMLASADPESSSGRAVTVLELLDDAAKSLNEGKMNHTPEVEAEVRSTIGRTYLSLGRQSEADANLAIALRILRSLPGDHQLSIATALRELARVRVNAGKLNEAAPLVHEAEEIFRALSPRPDAELDSCLQLIYEMNIENQGTDRRLELLQEIHAIRLRLYGETHPQVARVLSAMSLIQSDRTEALKLAQSAAEMVKETLGDHHPEYARMMVSVADSLLMNKRIEDAEQTYLDALRLMKEIHGPAHPDMNRCLADLIFLYAITNRQAERIQLISESVDISTRLYGPRSPNTGNLLVGLGEAQRRIEREAEAEATFRDALEILIENNEENTQTAIARISLAEILLARGDVEEAESLASACDGMSDTILASDHWARGIARILIGRVLARGKHYDNAEDWLLSGYEVLENNRVAQPRLKSAAQHIARFYDEWHGTGEIDKSAETAEWILRAEQIDVGTPFGTRKEAN